MAADTDAMFRLGRLLFHEDAAEARRWLERPPTPGTPMLCSASACCSPTRIRAGNSALIFVLLPTGTVPGWRPQSRRDGTCHRHDG
jgi:hypothetical protein